MSSPFTLKPKTNLCDRISFLIALLNDHFTDPAQIFDTKHHINGIPIHVQLSPHKSSLALVVYEITCSDDMLDVNDTMHSGCIATLYDNFSTYSVAALDKYWNDFDPNTETLESYAPKLMAKVTPQLGVTRLLQVTHQQQIPRGAVVKLEVSLLSENRKFATYTAKMTDEEGNIYSVMTHDKVKKDELKL